MKRRVRRIGEIDCLVCALQCLHAVAHVDRHGLAPSTMRDAHVWLYWADMPCVDPRSVEVRSKRYFVVRGNSGPQVGPTFDTLIEASNWARQNVEGFYSIFSFQAGV